MIVMQRSDGIEIAAADLAARLASLCPLHALDLAGAAALDGPAPHAEAWSRWLDCGLHGGLDYLERTREERSDPRRHQPWAGTMLVFAQRYTDGWPAADNDLGDAVFGDGFAADDWLAGVARYARGRDYHRILRRSVEGLLQGLRAIWPGLVADLSVDTGPYLERDWAWRAGLGFVGKNTCLIHESLGSGLVLAVAPTNLVISGLDDHPRPLYSVVAPERRHRSMPGGCGGCARCLEACPTGALVQPLVLNAGRCLSTWTIEHRGRAPAAERELQGGRIFGCDACQQACPWNNEAARRAASSDLWPAVSAAYTPLPEHAALSLADLVTLDSDGFRRCFRDTPLWRAHPEGMRRNALVVAANTGRIDLLEVVRAAAQDDPDPEVRAVAAWAAEMLEERS
jgi:epoxyqueuosine reductase